MQTSSVVLIRLFAAVLSVAPAVALQQRDRALALFDEVGLPAVTDAPLVKVSTGFWSQSSGEDPVNGFVYGFLLSDGGATFEVLTDDLRREIFTRTPRGTAAHERVGYEPVELRAFARQLVDAFPVAGERVFWSRGMHHPMAYHTVCTMLAFYAWAYDQKGERAAVRELVDCSLEAYRRSAAGGQRKLAGDLRSYVEDDLGHAAMWRLVVDFGDRSVSYDELHGRAARFLRMFPEHRHAERAAEIERLLAQMLAEAAARPALRAPFEELTAEEQAVELVFQLRDQNGEQWSQPGSCDVFADPRGDQSPAARLRAMGLAAMPALIDAIDDDSFTRSVGYHRNFHFSHQVLRVSECVAAVIGEISGMWFGGAAEASAWLEGALAKGEQTVWSEGARAGRITQAAWLAARYPDAAFEPIRTGVEVASDDYQRAMLVALVGSLDDDRARAFVVRQLEEGDDLRCRLNAAAAVLEWDREAALAAVIDLWRSGSMGDGQETVALFLAATGDPDAIDALGEHLDRLDDDVYLALGDGEAWLTMLTRPDGEGGWTTVRRLGDESWSDAALLAVEQLCLRGLDDDRVLHGNFGGVQDPQIQDFAARALCTRWPERYPFDFEAPRRERERQRIAMQNVARAARGEPLLEVPGPVEVEAVPVEAVEPLLARYLRVESDSDRERIAAEVLALGVGALVHVEPRLESADRMARPHLESLAQRLAGLVVAAGLAPNSELPAPDLESELGAMVGARADPGLIAGIAAQILRSPPEGVGGFVFDVERDAGRGGLVVTLSLRADPDPAGGAWCSAGSSIRAKVGSRGLLGSFGSGTFESYQRGERFDDFAEALRTALEAAWAESIEARIDIEFRR